MTDLEADDQTRMELSRLPDMIYEYELEHFSIIQSFDHELLDSFE